jgi:hypothetical protein
MVGFGLAVCLPIEVVVNCRFDVTKHRSWPRLNVTDGLWIRWMHAWPLHLFARESRQRNEALNERVFNWEEMVSDRLFKRTGVRYEVACDVIGALISHYAALIAAEEEKDSPDPDAIMKAEVAQKALRDERDALDSNDAEAIEAIIATYGPQARAVSNR